MIDRRMLLAAGLAAGVAGCNRRASSSAGSGTVEPATIESASAPTPLTVPWTGGESSSLKGLPAAPVSYIEQLGRAADTVTDEMYGHLVTGARVQTEVSPDAEYRANTLKYELLEDQSSYQAMIRKSAKARGRFGVFKGGGGFSSMKREAKSSYSLHICAIARRYDKATVFQDGTAKVGPELVKLVRDLRRRPPELIKRLGDSYVAAVTPANELFLDIIFETRSASKRNELKGQVNASYGSLASGGGSYAQVIRSARSHKSVRLEMTGLDASGVPQTFTGEEAQRILREFFADETRAKFANLEYRPVGNLLLDNRTLDWVVYADLVKREQFATRVMEALDILDNVLADAAYVEANPDEFDAGSRSRARDDVGRANAAGEAIVRLGEDTFAAFKDTGQTGTAFDRARVTALLPEFTPYPQVEPTPQPAPKPQPRPRPERDTDRGRNDHGGFGGRG